MRFSFKAHLQKNDRKAVLMFYVSYVVQFNEIFQKITFKLIFDDCLVYLLGKTDAYYYKNFKFKKRDI